MNTKEISGKKRESVGKVNTKLLRKQDLVPCVMYGGEKVLHFSCPELEAGKLVYTSHVFIVNLVIDGNKYLAIVKDLQFHPVTDKILHIDFLQVFEDKKLEIKIPVILHGFSVGVQQGGKLALQHRRLTVKGFIKDLPDQLDIDITDLVLGKTIKIAELDYENLELTDPKNWVVCSVKLTRVARGMAAGEDELGEGEESAEGVEGEEGAEGAEGAEKAAE